jgi:hypothetical protein
MNIEAARTLSADDNRGSREVRECKAAEGRAVLEGGRRSDKRLNACLEDHAQVTPGKRVVSVLEWRIRRHIMVPSKGGRKENGKTSTMIGY